MTHRRIGTSIARQSLALVVFGFAAVAPMASGCGDENAVVGGSCADGYVACDGRCVLGVVCGDGSGTNGDGAANGDGSAADGAANRDGSAGDGSANGDGSAGDGGLVGDGCPPPPYVTAAACGSCFVQCAAPNDTCRLNGSGVYTCQPPCTPPLVACNGQCIDVSSDPNNCGACGKVCASNLCVAGVCQGAVTGDIVVIGHDYRFTTPGSAQARVLTNAMLIPSSNPLRVLSYEKYAEVPAVIRVKQLATNAAPGRTIQYTVANDPSALASPNLAQSFDVVLVYDQQGAGAATLQADGTTWSPHLAKFTKAGGVVIALDGAGGSGAMPTLVKSAGLLDLAGHATLTAGSRVTILASNDVVGVLVPSPYGTFDRSASFTSNEANGGDVTFVAAVDLNPGIGAPVVVHKVVR